MSKPARIPAFYKAQTFLVTSNTDGKRSVFTVTQNAELFLSTLFSYRDAGKFRLHAFVLMPDHFHIILTLSAEMTLERSIQLIKGGFSYRMKKELNKPFEIWQRGFTDRRIRDRNEFIGYLDYVHDNPVKAGLVAHARGYPYSSMNPKYKMDPEPDYLCG